MDVLYLNNYNYIRGGAENVFLNEKYLMKIRKHKVFEFALKHKRNQKSNYENFFPKEMTTESVEIGAKQLRTLTKLFYNREAKNNLIKMLDDLHIDIAHAHNIYGGLTTSVLDALRMSNIPVLLTLHDYKLICPNYKLYAKGKICEDCKIGKFFMAVVNRCHKNSLVASSIYALETYFNELMGNYRKKIKYFISPSIFLKKKFEEFGWNSERIIYIPNFVDSSQYKPLYSNEKYIAYAGRLSEEKGIETLIKAFMLTRNKQIRLLVIGEGPKKNELRRISQNDSRIEFVGYLSGKKLNDVRRNALAIAVPSEWYENAPLTILEAFALGKPVIGSRIGGITEMIDEGVNGYLFEAGNIDELTHTIDNLFMQNERKIKELGKAAREKVKIEYSPERHYQKLIKTYLNALKY